MLRSLTPFLCLLAALLTGCPSAPPVAEAEPIPELTVVHSADLFSIGVDFFALSEDGNTFVAGSKYGGVGLYRTSDYAPLEKYYACEYVAPATLDGIASCNKKADTFGVGYIDANTWYSTGRVPGKVPEEDKYLIHVRSIHPSREIAVVDVGMADGAAAFPANKDYILQGNWLVDWRSGKHYAFNAPSDPRYTIIPTLTPDNRIVIHIDTDKYVGTAIIDPINDTTEYWKEAADLGERVFITPDNRHALGLSTANYKCTLWLWPERKKVGQCSPRLRGIFGSYPDHLEVVALSLDGKFFAIGFDNNVRVYRIEPLKLELEATTLGPVAQLALSDNGLLAAYDYRGFLRIWNIATGRLAGQRSLLDGKLHIAYSPKLAFQPGSGKLFTTYNDLTVFEIPRQAAQQKAESDPGTRKE